MPDDKRAVVYPEAEAWRKMKGLATVRTFSGSLRWAEPHWYEAHGAGRKGWKIKRFLD